MRADPPPPPARLTRTYGATLSGETDVAPDWLPFLARLAAELAPHSLADRLLAEGIEAIAYRAYLAGCEDGHRHGGAASYEDVLGSVRTQYTVAKIRASRTKRGERTGSSCLRGRVTVYTWPRSATRWGRLKRR